MLNFTVGPVQSCDKERSIGSQQVPYFRPPEFSAIMKENERLMCEFALAPEGSRAVFLTGSGTASMESVVMNVLNESDRAIVIDGGSFGRRFCKLCDIHGVPFDPLVLEPGKALTAKHLEPFNSAGFTAMIVNIHETSTGVRYDLDMISDFCNRNGLLLIVDAISSFLADKIDMSSKDVDVLITGSQKALACPPGCRLWFWLPKLLSVYMQIQLRACISTSRMPWGMENADRRHLRRQLVRCCKSMPG